MAKLLIILILSGALADSLPSDPPLLIDSAPYHSPPLDAAR